MSLNITKIRINLIKRISLAVMLAVVLLSIGCADNQNGNATPPNGNTSTASGPATTTKELKPTGNQPDKPEVKPEVKTAAVDKSKPADAADAEKKESPLKKIKFTDINGRNYEFKDLQGKVVLFVYWATWCGPCRREIPALNNIHEKYNNRAVIISINQDNEMGILNDFLKQDLGRSIKYPIVYGLNYPKVFGRAAALPTLYLVDKQGNFIDKHEGSLPEEALSAVIEQYL